MKFLVTVKPGPMPPPLEAVQAAQAWIQDRLDDGTFETVYAFPHGGGMSISDSASAEELMDRLLDYPLSPFVDYAVEPLVDLGAAFTRIIAVTERMQAQMAAQH